MTRRAVILARGLGTRMRATDPAASLTPDQARAADAGLKAMMPVNGRPFLDYVLSSVADAGIARVALIVAPDHQPIAHYYDEDAPPARVQLTCVVQPQALGTANAILAAEAWCAGDPFIALNGDNLYPTDALSALHALEEPGLAIFSRGALVRESNIPPERIAAFALVDVDAQGYLARIVEKPERGGDARPVSMNCWRFDRRIFDACRDVPRSRRGEYELPDAVSLAMSRGVRFRCFHASGPVLDLSTRADAADVERRLAGTRPAP